ncbi:MAG: aminopeptidase P family protein [Chitinispirillales bacterium]|jgi:Xaa-Pro aminopeptidase|nr:aminopeptidase P family protein [Chitinispirillales bacterium]
MINRFEKANILLKKFNADYILINGGFAARYFSGFHSSNVFLLYSPEQKFLLTDFRYKTKASDFCEKENWEFIEIKNGEFCKGIDKIIKKSSKLLIQDNVLTLENFEIYKKNIKNVLKFIPAGKEINALFYIKTENERNSIKQAAKIGDISFSQWCLQIKEGMSEFEAAQLLNIITLQNGSEKSAFDTIVLFGENSSFPHGVPSKTKILKKGDFILSDFGCTVDGFCSDMTRTICFGEPKREHVEIYNIVFEAQKIGLDAVKAGVKANEADKKIRDFIAGKGFGENFGHGSGHCIGLNVHENPALNTRDETILEEGMILTIEPGIYIPSIVGVRIEDMVIVGEKSCEIITKTAKNFIEI